MSSPPLPRRFGSYLLLRELGHGGMGEVFIARPLVGGLPAPLVVKTLHDRLADEEEALQRFRHEAEIGVSVDSSHLVRVFDVGLVGAQPYLAMEYVRGWSVLEVLRAFLLAKRVVPVPLAVHLLLDVLAGLDALHLAVHPETGIPLGAVHRDVSPRNVMVRDTGRAVVIDLGLGRSNVQAWRTRAGATLGTPGYMSPEQASGERVDQRSDLYNAAQVLWELLAAERYVPRAEVPALLAAMRAPVWRSAAERRVDVPAGLDRVLERALAVRPDHRYPTARALAEALRPFASAAPEPLPRELGLAASLARAEESLAELLLIPATTPDQEPEGVPTEVTRLAMRTVVERPAELRPVTASSDGDTASGPVTVTAPPPREHGMPGYVAQVSSGSAPSVRPPAPRRSPVLPLVAVMAGLMVTTAAVTVWRVRTRPVELAPPTLRPVVEPTAHEAGPRVSARDVPAVKTASVVAVPAVDVVAPPPRDRARPAVEVRVRPRLERDAGVRAAPSGDEGDEGARRARRLAALRGLQVRALQLARSDGTHAEELRELAADAALWSRSTDDAAGDRALEELQARLGRLARER